MDLMLRGRGAEIGVRAPQWVVRLCGAALGMAAMSLADWLGASYVTGVGPMYLRAGAGIIGALVAPSVLGAGLWMITIALAIVVTVVSMTPIVFAPAHFFVRSDPDGAAVDAVVVFSGSLNSEGRLIGPVLERMLTGLHEVQRRHIPVLALSVVDRDVPGGRVTTEGDQRALAAMLGGGVDVRFVRDTHSTRDEALAFAALARTHGWTRVLAVTSPLHTRRACLAMEVAGLAVQCLPAESRSYSLANLNGSVNRLLIFQDVVYEWAATILYRSRGWI